VKFFVDENLSPLIVAQLQKRGHVAEKPEHVGLGGAPDPVVWAWAYSHDEIVITANAEDYLLLASRSELHAGLIIIRPGHLTRAEQWDVLLPVICALEAREEGPLLNEYVEIYGLADFTWPPRTLPPK
jgi:predicted nuclease of predicted toxin-antitoxin system